MKTILMLGTNNGSIELVNKAKSMGYYTIVTDYLEPAISKAKLYSDEYWMIDTSHIDELVDKSRLVGVDAVICGISAFNIMMAIKLCERLNLPFYCNEELFHYTMNKRDFKDLCKKHNVSVATDYNVSNPVTDSELNKIKFPVVVKAVDQSANRGMSYCYKKEDIQKAIDYAHKFSNNQNVVVEKMLNGKEYTAYYALADGHARLVNLFSDLSQPGTPGKCYSVNSTICDQLDTYLEQIDPYFVEMLESEGFKDGVCWIELLFDQDKHFYVIEMGYRMTGDMMAIPIYETTGFDSYKWLLETSLGIQHTIDDLPMKQNSKLKKCGCSYILWNKNVEGVISEINGLEKIEDECHLTINADVGQKFRPEQYILTFSFARNNVIEICNMIKKINEEISVCDENGDDILIRFNDFDTLKEMDRG